jgi:DNA-binding LacI/PurR family transcriptional regulator
MGDSTSTTGASIQDVARVARVSPSTVSRVLNHRASGVAISPATAERVRAAAEALRYRPNASARSLRTAKTQTIGVIVRDLLAPFTAEFLGVIYAICRERGYHVLVGNAGHNVDEGWALGDILSPDRVDGILLLGDVLRATASQKQMAAFVQEHRHVVTVGCRPSLAGEISISVDNARGVALALEYLFEAGHRSIAYFGATRLPHAGGEEQLRWEDEQRWDAYCRFVEAHGLPYGAAYAALVPSDLTIARNALQHVLSAPVRPTAAFVSNDMSALVLLKVAVTYGLRVPDDLSIIGFDDIPFAMLSTPGLTTVRQPIADMARYAASALLDRITGVEPAISPANAVSGTTTAVFPPTLVCRESVRPYQPKTPPTSIQRDAGKQELVRRKEVERRSSIRTLDGGFYLHHLTPSFV